MFLKNNFLFCLTPVQDELPINGFTCNHDGISEVICPGPGNPAWKEFLQNHKAWCQSQKSKDESCTKEPIEFNSVEDYDSIRISTVHHLKGCTILDGNMILEVGHVAQYEVIFNPWAMGVISAFLFQSV